MHAKLLPALFAAALTAACAPTDRTHPATAAAPKTPAESAPPKAVAVSPAAPPEVHPLAPESLPNKPETIPEEMPGAKPPR